MKRRRELLVVKMCKSVKTTKNTAGKPFILYNLHTTFYHVFLLLTHIEMKYREKGEKIQKKKDFQQCAIELYIIRHSDVHVPLVLLICSFIFSSISVNLFCACIIASLPTTKSLAIIKGSRSYLASSYSFLADFERT